MLEVLNGKYDFVTELMLENMEGHLKIIFPDIRYFPSETIELSDSDDEEVEKIMENQVENSSGLLKIPPPCFSPNNDSLIEHPNAPALSDDLLVEVPSPLPSPPPLKKPKQNQKRKKKWCH